jgi:hypothetical protein
MGCIEWLRTHLGKEKKSRNMNRYTASEREMEEEDEEEEIEELVALDII